MATGWIRSLPRERERCELLRVGAELLALRPGRRNQPLVHHVPRVPDRLLAGELRDVLAHPGDAGYLEVLHVEVERSRERVDPGRDVLEGRGLAADGGVVEGGGFAADGVAADPVRVLLQEAVAEDPEGVRVGDEFLDDQVVVLAGVDPRAVLADRLARLLEGFLV